MLHVKQILLMIAFGLIVELVGENDSYYRVDGWNETNLVSCKVNSISCLRRILRRPLTIMSKVLVAKSIRDHPNLLVRLAS